MFESSAILLDVADLDVPHNSDQIAFHLAVEVIHCLQKDDNHFQKNFQGMNPGVFCDFSHGAAIGLVLQTLRFHSLKALL